MSGHSLTRQLPISRKCFGFSPEYQPPIFLAPLLASIPQFVHPRSSFSTTAALSVRSMKKRDGNPQRGESALRRTGLRYPNAMSKQLLPKPVLDRKLKIEVDPDHGLWGFFNKDRKALTPPEDDTERGMLCASCDFRPTNWCRSPLDG